MSELLYQIDVGFINTLSQHVSIPKEYQNVSNEHYSVLWRYAEWVYKDGVRVSGMNSDDQIALSLKGFCESYVSGQISIEIEEAFYKVYLNANSIDSRTSTSSSSSENNANSACFVATVVYGSSECKQIKLLREFRDQVLLVNPKGKLLVGLYYRIGPRLAAKVARYPPAKAVCRMTLDCLVMPVIQRMKRVK